MTRASYEVGARSWRECRAAAKSLAGGSDVRRSFSEGGPDNGEHGPGPEIPRGAPKGERPVAGNARRLMQAGWLPGVAQIDRTPGPPVVRNERKAGSPGLRKSMRRLRVGHDAPRRVPRMHP